MIDWFCGNSDAGKTTAAKKLLAELTVPAVHLDGDVLRSIWSDLGFSKGERIAHNYRVGRLAKMLEDQDLHVVVSVIAPYRDVRAVFELEFGVVFHYLPGGKSGVDYPFEPPEEEL